MQMRPWQPGEEGTTNEEHQNFTGCLKRIQQFYGLHCCQCFYIRASAVCYLLDTGMAAAHRQRPLLHEDAQSARSGDRRRPS